MLFVTPQEPRDKPVVLDYGRPQAAAAFHVPVSFPTPAAAGLDAVPNDIDVLGAGIEVIGVYLDVFRAGLVPHGVSIERKVGVISPEPRWQAVKRDFAALAHKGRQAYESGKMKTITHEQLKRRLGL